MKWDSSGEAIPAYFFVKQDIVMEHAAAIQSLAEYRQSRNPMDLYDFAKSITKIHDMIIMDIQTDEKLRKNIPNLLGKKDYPGMSKYYSRLPFPLKMDADEWVTYFHEICGMLYAMNIIRLTREKDSDDDFAGVPGMSEAYNSIIKKYGDMLDGDKV